MEKRTLLIQILCSIVAVAAIVYGSKFSVPDAESISYGFPFNWGLHQLMTIAGPVDIWDVNITNLTIDIGFWLLIIIATPILLEKIQK